MSLALANRFPFTLHGRRRKAAEEPCHKPVGRLRGRTMRELFSAGFAAASPAVLMSTKDSKPRPPARCRRPRARAIDGVFDLLLAGTHDSCAYRVTPTVTSRSAIFPLRLGPIRWASATALSDVSTTQDLDVFEQLCAGVRFLDVRVSKLAREWEDARFWTVHGMAVCVPLEDILEQVNAFHDSVAREDNSPEHYPIPVISVFRCFCLDETEMEELAAFIQSRLRGGIFSGSVKDLRSSELASLPRNIVAGVPGLSDLPLHFGHDHWKDTYKPEVKIEFLVDYLCSLRPRLYREDMSVVGWTVTPQLKDVVLRLLGLNILCRPLRVEATKLNRRFPLFLKSQGKKICSSANVIFCDFIDSTFVNTIIELRNGWLQDDKI